jgi:two-component system, OmpR family, sensor histidine kinase SenX3
MGEVVNGCIDRLRTLHKIEDGAVEFEPGPPATVLGDPDEVHAAVSNLIDNAVKYSGRPMEVRIRVEPVDDRYVALRVSDNGQGIPKSDLKRIFKRFYRVPGPLAAKIKGTGLGLYIVRSVAKRHGGRVWAESEGPGRGSTFVLQLPVAK